ncbi:MAG: insulinase family protein [Candidatus Binatia bacterium]|nr:insulinase family protein [Candidatus Binatia bacterium]
MIHDVTTLSPTGDDRLLFTLDNGLRVAIQEDHFAPVVAIQVWVKAGSADETPDVAGAAHVHEHMIFKGTTRRPVGAIAAEVESSGGQINAFTTADHTVYHLVLASRYFSTGLDILADAMRNATFDPHELAKELHVVMEEWKRGEDSPTSRAATELFRLAYTTHPYGRPVIGYRETIEALNRERVLQFYQRWYHPNNMTLVIVGDVDRETARHEVMRFFADQQPGDLPPRPRVPEPPQRGLRFSIVNMNVEEFYLYLCFPIPHAAHPDVFALDLLGYILGGGESARLVQTLQADKELVNWISAYAYTPADPGLFIVAAGLEREKVRPAIEEILSALFQCKYHLVSPAELARARTNLASDFIYRRETVQGQARQLGYFLTVFNNADYERQYLDGLSAVTRQDIQRVAQHYFSAETLSLTLLGATAHADLPTAAEVHALCRRLDRPPLAVPNSVPKRDGRVTVAQLDNGIRLLVKEHHAVPVMSLQAVVLGGLLFEDEHNTGINNFLAGLLTRGSERFSRQALAEAVESLAGSLRGFSGRNSLGLSGAFLSTPRFDKALELFLDTLLHPTFPEEEVEKRRREVLLALKNREDDLAQVAFDLFYETIFTTHPYRFPLLGNEATVRTLTRAQLVEYYRTLLNPARLVISVVGDVDTTEVVAYLRDALGQLPMTSTAVALPPPEPRATTPRRKHKVVDKQQAHLVLGFHSVTLTDPDRYPLKVLDAILSRQGGRLFYELREKRALAYSVTAFAVEGIAPGVFGVYVGTDPTKVDEAVAAVWGELRRVRDELVSPAELEQAKKYLTGSYEISLQSNASQAEEMAFNELYGLGYDNGRRYLAAIAHVTAHDLQRVARTYFDEHAYTLVTVGR